MFVYRIVTEEGIARNCLKEVKRSDKCNGP